MSAVCSFCGVGEAAVEGPCGFCLGNDDYEVDEREVVVSEAMMVEGTEVLKDSKVGDDPWLVVRAIYQRMERIRLEGGDPHHRPHLRSTR